MKALLLAAFAWALPPAHEAPSYPGVGAAVTPPSVRESSVLRTQAIDHFRQGLFREAARLFRVEATSAPAEGDAWRDAMWAHWFAGQFVGARQAGHKLLEVKPRDLEGLNLTARAHLFAGERRDALEDYLDSLEVDATQLTPRRAVARLYEWFREYRRAIRYAKWVLEDAPDDASSHALIGRAWFYLLDYRESAKAWHEAVKYEPENRDYRLGEAQALYFAGKEDQAVELVGGLLAENDRFWPAVDFYVNVMLVRRDFGAAAAALERALRRVEPRDEPRLMFLARIYAQQGRDQAFMAAVDRALELNPDNGSALLAMAAHLSARGRGFEAQRFYERVIDLNPGSFHAWKGLADSLMISSQPAQAIEAVGRARALDPTDPHLLVLQARYMFQAGRREESKKLLLDWLEANRDEPLPVVLYHGVTPFPRDPDLAGGVSITTATFEDHIRALSESGFRPVTAEQAAAWFRGQLTLPEKPVLVTFDDGLISSVRYADPILRKYGFRATMYMILSSLDLNIHTHLSWRDLEKMRKTGRWDVQSHGVWSHNSIDLDREGRQGIGLVNRKPGETEDQFIARVRRDHEDAKRRLEEKIGRLPSTFAYPQGDFGQLAVPNFPYSAELNLKLCRESYSVCFHQDNVGINPRSRDPAMAVRVRAKPEWKGADLVELIGDEDPRVLVRRQLIAHAIFERRGREALRWLRENQDSGASDALNLSDEARIRFSFGDRARGLGMAREALRLDEEAEYRRLRDDLERRMRPALLPTARYVTDNRDRRHFTAETGLSNVVAGYNLLKPLAAYGRWSESRFPVVTGQGVGLEAGRHLTLFQALTVRAVGYKLSDGQRRPFTASASLRSHWFDPFYTDVEAGAQHMLTARAVAADVRERFGAVSAGLVSVDSWDARARARYGRLTDDNERFQGTLRLSKPVGDWDDLRAVYQFTAETATRRSERYYSPKQLLTNQLGLSWLPELSEDLRLELTYLPGYGMESGVPPAGDNRPQPPARRIVHLFTASAAARLGPVTAKPLVTLSRSPLYQANTYGVNLGWQF